MTTLPFEPVPEGWAVAELGEITTKIGSGATPRGGSSVYTDSGTAFIRSQNVHDHLFEDNGLAHIDESAARALNGVTVQPGDVLIDITGESILRCCLAPARVLPARVSQHVAIIRPDQRLRSLILQKYLTLPEMKDYMIGHSSGGTRKAITKGHIASFPVPIPPMHEQDTIVSILGAIDDKIAVDRRIASRLRRLADLMFERHARRDSGWSEIINPDRTLGSVLSVLEVGGRPKGGVHGIDSGVPSIGAESVIEAGVFDYSKTKYVPTEFFKAMTRGQLQDRDVLLYKDGGRPGQFEPHVSMIGESFPFQQASINEHVYRMRIEPPYSQDLLYLWLRTGFMFDEMRRRGTGVAIPGLNSTNVRDLPIFDLDKPSMTKLKDDVQPLLSAVLRLARQGQELVRLRSILQPRLIKGQLRVAELAEMGAGS